MLCSHTIVDMYQENNGSWYDLEQIVCAHRKVGVPLQCQKEQRVFHPRVPVDDQKKVSKDTV